MPKKDKDAAAAAPQPEPIETVGNHIELRPYQVRALQVRHGWPAGHLITADDLRRAFQAWRKGPMSGRSGRARRKER